MAAAAMTIASRTLLGVATVLLAFLVPAKADVVKELAPTGKLRVAIAIAPAPLRTLCDQGSNHRSISRRDRGIRVGDGKKTRRSRRVRSASGFG